MHFDAVFIIIKARGDFMKTKQINTKCGKIKGIDGDDCVEYRGIRYAAAKRWEYPELIKKWDGVYDATDFGECSYQHRGFDDDSKVNPFYHNEFRRNMTFTYSEDCQFLNIYAPKQAKSCPVLIYIHGGSFTGGSANEAHIDGRQFAKNGVIFVTMNYRLNAFGFCSHPDLTDSNGVCGNFGLYDQYAALKWIKENISDFGGDPNRMTLCGQSAGAMSVDVHISSPLCKGWFSGAIMMSGGGLQRTLARPLTPEKTRGFWDAIIKNAGVKDIFELKNADREVLYRAWDKACKDDALKSMVYTLPVYDGGLLTKETFNMNTIPKMPKIIGLTQTDMVPSVLEAIDKKWVRKDSQSDVYIYLFARNLPGDDKGAWHSCDLLYAFSTLMNNWRPFESVDYEISNQMSKSFTAFAKTGNPNCNAIPKWTAGSKKIMTFCENTASKRWLNGRLLKNTVTKGTSI